MSGPFRFKQFSIDDSHCAMKVGMDAVLLGAWTNVDNVRKILDIGTGTGIISIMLAQKSNALIDAVEIDKDAYEQAKINITNSGWQEKINAYNSSVQNFCILDKSIYNLIVTNPPYFINSYKATVKTRKIARHNDLLSQEDIINTCLRLLKKNGRLCLILPINEGLIFKTKALYNKLFCNKITYIIPKIYKNPNRMLMEFSFIDHDLIENELIIEKEQRHHFTEEYKELTKNYYLAF